jgi:hypothetical protein
MTLVRIVAVLFLSTAAVAQATQPAINGAGTENNPSEPGMYVQTKSGFAKILGQIVAFRRSGSLLVSSLTLGIKTRKENVQLLGSHAQTVVGGNPVFYFIPPRQEVDAGVNAGDLVLMRLEGKTKRRQFEVGAAGVWRASSGISITHQFELFRSEVRPGVYTITPSVELAKGQYALYLARGEGMQAYVYDFTVSSACCELSRHAEGGRVPTVPPSTISAGVIPTLTESDTGAGGLKKTGKNESPSVRPTGEATAEISSEPAGADIEIDGSFVGTTPSLVGIRAGKHTMRVSKRGYERWERTLESSTGKINIAAVLEPMHGDKAGTSHTSAEVGATPTIGDPEPLTSPAGNVTEESRIGVWFTGNPTVKHDGLQISSVQPNGPAFNVGIESGDVIISMDGQYLYTVDDLRAELKRHEEGTRLLIRYRRDRLTYENYLTLISRQAAARR